MPFHFGRTSGSSYSTIIEARETCFLPDASANSSPVSTTCGSRAGLKNRNPQKIMGCDLYSLPQGLGIIRPMRGLFLAAQPPERLTARLPALGSLRET
jgi:hypothetical protein